MVWVAHEVVLVALANGYVVLVSALLLMRQRKNASATAHGRAPEESPPVPVTAKSMSTTRIFQNYLTAAIELEGSPAVLGDTSLKVLSVDMAKWGTDGCLSMWVERSELSTRLTHPLAPTSCHACHAAPICTASSMRPSTTCSLRAEGS